MPFRDDRSLIYCDPLQTSSASSSPDKSAQRLTSSTPPQPYSDSARHSDPSSAKSLPLIRSCRFCGISSCTMCAISPFSTRPARRSSGRISCRWCVCPLLPHCHVRNAKSGLMEQFLESFANKHVSSSEDRLEETKRRKLARKCEKLIELMMVSGVPTASGYEERVQFSEMEVIDRGADENGILVNIPEGHSIHGWDVNVAAVRVVSVKRTVRYHPHAVSGS